MPPTPGLGLRGRAVRGPFGDAQVHAVPALIAANHTRSKAADSTDPEMHLGSAQRPPRRAASMGSSGLQRSASCCGSSRRSAAPSSRCSSGIATPTLRGAARSGMERGHDMPNGARSRAHVLGRRGIIQGGRGQHGRTARDARVEILPRAAACTARIGKRRPLRSRSRGFRGEVPAMRGVQKKLEASFLGPPRLRGACLSWLSLRATAVTSLCVTRTEFSLQLFFSGGVVGPVSLFL